MKWTKAQKIWINQNISLIDYLGRIGVDIPPNGKIFCPFHDNRNTPAAKVYIDNRINGTGLIRCYAEQRSYGVFDICIRILNYDTETIKSLVPQEYWYSLGFEEEAFELPIVDTGIQETYKSNVFGYIQTLDYMYRNKEQYRCRRL